jgi:hypothetical protein
LASEEEKRAADAGLERALRRVMRVYDLLPDEPNAVDFMRAFHAVCTEIMEAAFESLEEAWQKGSAEDAEAPTGS